MVTYHITVSAVNIAALLVLDYIIRKNDAASAKIKRFFRLSILIIMMAIVAEVASVYLEGAPALYRGPNIIVNVIGFSVSPLIPLLTGCAISDRRKKAMMLFWVPAGVNVVASVLSAQVPVIFSVNVENVYSRGEYFWIYIVAYGVGMVYLFLETLVETIRYQNKNRSVLLVLFLFLVLGTSIQVVAPQQHISWLCISFAICLYYTYYCELYHQIDGLTELLNRHAYEGYLSKMNNTKDVAILVFDIDDFKNINDAYGHPFGDYCLTVIASYIKKVFFGIGLCFRIGGDEFCVISRNVDRTVMAHACQKFLGEIASMQTEEKRLPTVSIGYSFYDRAKGTMDECMMEADRQMYGFKQKRDRKDVTGRNNG